jgi:tRNA G18 (ribose-2'-O)-methylase SpoU
MLFLHDLQSPINIGLILRAGEQFQIDVAMCDARGILKNKSKLLTISDFSCGALDRRPPRIVSSMAAFRKKKSGRMIAACLDKNAKILRNFVFEPNDVILFGNEYDGLSREIIVAADAKLYIPLPPGAVPKPRSYSPIDPKRVAAVGRNGLPNLNVAMAATIIGYEMYSQRRHRSRAIRSRIKL